MTRGQLFLFAMAISAARCSTSRGAVTMEFVYVGYPADARESLGGEWFPWYTVDYVFCIGRYEVTNAQYIEFLNAVAALADPHELYNIQMTDTYGGISRVGSGTTVAPWVYGPKDGDSNWLNRPVNYVSAWDAYRFCNWLHNGQPSGLQDSATTEDGAYDISTVMTAWMEFPRKPGARVFLPDLSEFRKAALYYPAGNFCCCYATGTVSGVPGGWDPPPFPHSPQDDDGHSANLDCMRVLGGPITPYGTTEVGAYRLSPSPFGTFDQAGNVQEWTETTPDTQGGSYLEGGSWSSEAFDFGNMWDASPYEEVFDVGFRVASVPEPAALVMLGLGGLASLKRRGIPGTSRWSSGH